MIESIIAKSYALEPRFHNVQAALMLRRLSAGASLADMQAGFEAERAKRMPFMVNALAPQKIAGDFVATSNTAKTKAGGNVAIIPIIGSMSRYGGMCSYGSEDIAAWVQEANQLDYISAIVLNINSPGGEVDGTELLGAVVAQSKKPVVAYVTGMAASAAYWVASQASEIVMESGTTSDVGSIGVLSMHVDASAFYEKEGYKIQIIRSDGSEDKALYNSFEPISESTLAQVKAELNIVRETFISTVKAGRPGISGKVFSGKMYPGRDAIKLGMADRVGYLGDAVYRADLLARRNG